MATAVRSFALCCFNQLMAAFALPKNSAKEKSARTAAIETGTDDGMLNFNQALFHLVKEGRVSQKEAMAKASNPQALEMNFKGIFLDEGRRILGS